MGAVSVFMTGKTSTWRTMMVCPLVVATVAFFVVVVLLASLEAIFSFHRYRHNNSKNEIKWLKNMKKIARKCSWEANISIFLRDALDVDLKKRDSICISATKIFALRASHFLYKSKPLGLGSKTLTGNLQANSAAEAVHLSMIFWPSTLDFSFLLWFNFWFFIFCNLWIL